MSWRCPKCGNRNADSDANCTDCYYKNEIIPNQGGNINANAVFHMTANNTRVGQSEVNAQQSPVTQRKWIIVCPTCGRKIPVASEDSGLEKCPECGSRDIDSEEPRGLEELEEPEDISVQPDEWPLLYPRIFIQEIRAIPEVSNKFIYHQKGRTPDFISDRIEIPPPEKVFGRNDLPQLGDYYRTISEKHCKFRCDDNGDWFVSDMNSTNGTIVNGRHLIGGKTEVKLTQESEIQMANRLFAVFIE